MYIPIKVEKGENQLDLMYDKCNKISYQFNLDNQPSPHVWRSRMINDVLIVIAF